MASKAKGSDQDHGTTAMEVDAAITNAAPSTGPQSTDVPEPYPDLKKNPSRLPPSVTIGAAALPEIGSSTCQSGISL